jgi:riboflavin synthase
MFTGLIEEVGRVLTLERGEPSRLAILAQETKRDLTLGASIAVDGVCLTVTRISDASFTVDLSPETLRVTTLGRLRGGEGVNLERPLRLGDRLGGHWVSGHVDGVASILERRSSGDSVLLGFSYPSQIAEFLVPKGSVAVDGISLTVVKVQEDLFTVQIIPFTYRNTTLVKKRVGDPVNLEGDLVAKYLKRLLPPYRETGERGGSIDMDFLAKHGFLS